MGTNATVIPGEQTIPDSMLTPNKGFARRNNPWFAPGTAPVHSPCGVWGGNPGGCRSGDPSERFGDCCGNNCGGWSFGTTVQEVAWHVNAKEIGKWDTSLITSKCRLTWRPASTSSPSVGIVRQPPRSGTPAPTSTSYDAFYSFSNASS